MSSIGSNRAYWNQISGRYQAEHDPQIGAAPRLWGMFCIPDEQLRAVGDVTGRRVLELGCYDDESGNVAARLRRDYHGQEVVEEGDGAVSFQLGYGDWIRTLRGAGLTVEDLIEPRPEPEQRSGYMKFEPPDWASRWPAEMLWIARMP